MILQQKELLTRIHKEALLSKIRSEEQNVDLLLAWSQLTQQPIGWRATWLLRQVLKKNDTRLHPHIPSVLKKFSDFNESQKREWLKAMRNQSMNEEEEGMLFDLSINEWRTISRHPALRASAAVIIIRVLKNYPELNREIQHLFEEHYLTSLSPGIRRSLEKSLQKLKS